ncbi:hypothetical protein H0H81_001176 [Sphagnurus paluster]|uniref:Uncharacterized protein n=1 Tax=Sphagnurus paluster TaxID=117069 RepID=A0A9P7GW80_9AGAR|nr:hypothetical protein H0H81_001176 [Sphagnurus paluster]
MFPETQRYRFSLEDDPENFDRNLFEYFSWSTKNDGTLDRIKTNITRLVVAFQPPWILSDTDIQQFAKRWTHGFVSEVFSYDSRKPSIAECLIFWLASAMRMTGTPSLPNVPEPISHVFMPPGLSSVKKPDVNALITTNSESHWDGKSDEVPSSAGVQLTDSDLLDEFTDTVPRAYNNITLRKELLSEWLKKAEDPGSSRNDLSIVPKRMRRMLPEAIDLCYGDWLV